MYYYFIFSKLFSLNLQYHVIIVINTFRANKHPVYRSHGVASAGQRCHLGVPWVRLARQVQTTNLLLQCGQAARENSQWNVAVIDSHENKVRTIKIYNIKQLLRPAAFCLRRRSRQRRDAANIMSSRNGKNQPQLSPANVGHVTEAQRKADNRKGQRQQEKERKGERQCCALFVRLLCAARSLQYRFVFFCGAALHGHLLCTKSCIHLGARSLALSLCFFFLRSHSTPSLALSLFHTLSVRCCCAAYASFFQASPIPSAFLTIFITQSLSLCQPVATTTTIECCCSCSCCFLGIAAFYAAK